MEIWLCRRALEIQMVPEAAFSAEQRARIFWLAHQTALNLIEGAEIEEAAEYIRAIGSGGERLLSGPKRDHLLGRRMVEAAASLRMRVLK